MTITHLRSMLADEDVRTNRIRRYVRLENQLDRDVARAVTVVRCELPACWRDSQRHLALMPSLGHEAVAGRHRRVGDHVAGDRPASWCLGVVPVSVAAIDPVVSPRSFRRRLPAITRRIVDGRSRRAGGSSRLATLKSCPARTISCSAAAW